MNHSQCKATAVAGSVDGTLTATTAPNVAAFPDKAMTSPSREVGA